MRALALLAFAAAGALWSWAVLGLRRLMADPYPRIVRWSRAVNIDPNDTQWLAELLDDSRAAIRLVLLTVWVLGLLLLALAAVLAVRGPEA